jgi:hypothetical protein
MEEGNICTVRACFLGNPEFQKIMPENEAGDAVVKSHVSRDVCKFVRYSHKELSLGMGGSLQESQLAHCETVKAACDSRLVRRLCPDFAPITANFLLNSSFKPEIRRGFYVYLPLLTCSDISC